MQEKRLINGSQYKFWSVWIKTIRTEWQIHCKWRNEKQVEIVLIGAKRLSMRAFANTCISHIHCISPWSSCVTYRLREWRRMVQGEKNFETISQPFLYGKFFLLVWKVFRYSCEDDWWSCVLEAFAKRQSLHMLTFPLHYIYVDCMQEASRSKHTRRETKNKRNAVHWWHIHARN